MKINHKVSIHAYKYDGCLYRTFEFPKIIYVDKKITILSQNDDLSQENREKKPKETLKTLKDHVFSKDLLYLCT